MFDRRTPIAIGAPYCQTDVPVAQLQKYYIFESNKNILVIA
jgi:hypothetical protein